MKSPIKDKPLRNPGESITDQIWDLLFSDILPYCFVSGMLAFVAAMEWLHWYIDIPPNPFLSSFLAIVSIAYTAFKFYRFKPKLKALKQGRDGEMEVGQGLEELREKGSKVFHDIPAKDFNLDHVVVDISGIYVIETKTYSKPDQGESVIVFNGTSVWIDKKTKTKKPIIQVSSAANWLAGMLKESTGKQFAVKPVVLFPGWYIQLTSDAKNSKVWVLNPKALPAFIGHSKEQLQPEDVNLVSFHISRYVRSYPK